MRYAMLHGAAQRWNSGRSRSILDGHLESEDANHPRADFEP
jgi:hypothetical protein